jgi:competence protein ComEA
MRKLNGCFFWVTLVVVILLLIPTLGAQDAKKININTASAAELVQLKGIGEKKAEKIIEFREAHGPFETPEDLVKVPGIGLKTYETNKEELVVE